MNSHFNCSSIIGRKSDRKYSQMFAKISESILSWTKFFNMFKKKSGISCLFCKSGEGHVDCNIVAAFATPIAVVARRFQAISMIFQRSQALENTNFIGFLYVMLSSISDY